MSRSLSRTPPPRQLGAKETLESLSHWRTTFRTFYKKDDTYRIFFKSTAAWNYHETNFGQTAETEGEKRTPGDLKEDLTDLLNTLAGYLPHSYLTDKILKSTKNWEEVWTVIYDHYNVQVTSESLLDFEDLHKLAEETHRQFYERLLQHTKQHLAPKNVKVETHTNTEDDKMSISLMNMVALQWLRKTHKSLIHIVRTEYSTELRSNVQLADLVPRIAPNIDPLLRRYEIGSSSNRITAEQPETVDAANVNKTWGRGGGSSSSAWRGRSGRGRDTSRISTRPPTSGRSTGPFCPGCYYLSKQLGTTIHFQHTPGDCPRKAVTVKMFQMEDQEHFEDVEEVDDASDIGKIGDLTEDTHKPDNYQKFQILITESPQNEILNTAEALSREPVVETAVVQTPTSRHSVDVLLISDPIKMELNSSELFAKVRQLENRKSNWANVGIRKSKSPCTPVQIKKAHTFATIDEGSEINCIDEGFATRNSIKFVPTECKAVAAGSTSMVLAGQTQDEISPTIVTNNKPILLTLGKMVVVKNLGVDLLVGEPGKLDNKIVTYPHEKMIEMSNIGGKRVKIPYFSKSSQAQEHTFRCKSVRKVTIYPNEKINVKLPVELRKYKHFSITPKYQELYPWVRPESLTTNGDGSIDVTNGSDIPVRLSKHEHFADLTVEVEVSLEDLQSGEYVRKIYDLSRDDLSHLIPSEQPVADKENYLDEISIDPDNILTPAWQTRFRKICSDFSDIITPRPGKYNGGRIDNSINFTAAPPPSIRSHLPKYTHDMLKIMGDKMDKLEEWGVLKKPEDIGVVPEFVVPSMLLPKTERGEWRLVTDFTPLNIHIKKLETTAPTIKEAKEKLAKFDYHIQLDLSNYFYQGGMKIEDCQYLATPHPFKGLRVYTCEPQGLKNASEHAYERLGLVYGDMCADERMTRMADGLYVLADTLEDLEKNFLEVLNRASLCGFTFKPAKVIIVPHETVLFGWKKTGTGWAPTTHTVSPLIKADPPLTVKQARSWIGSFKQLTECIPRYAELLGPLEAVLGGRASAERIVWTQDLLKSFEKLKKSLNDLKTVYVPKPSDTLHTFSDFSQSEKAVGGRLEIHRKVDGKIKKLIGGHFSCRVTSHQKKWYPCEGEALGTRMILDHFSPYIRESENMTIHHTDNQPVVQAWRRSKTGAFSASARISAFLTGVSALNIEIIHTPGKDMKSSDYNSRHPEECSGKICQICKFAEDLETIGDKVMKVSVADIENGTLNMPYTQRSAWLKVQKTDKVHQQLSFLIDSSQLPNKKKTKGDHTYLKRLHNLFKTGQLRKESDGLITVTHMDPEHGNHQAISVPTSMFPGLVQAIHIKLDHPSKMQLQKLLTRYFYSPGFARVIEEVTLNCSVCASLKQLPQELFSENTTKTPIFGANFSADVIRMHGQKIFLAREKLSQFTTTLIISDETAESFRNALVLSTLEFIPSSGASVQVDCATALQALETESESKGSVLKQLGIKVETGRTKNVNKNPIAENAIKEFHKERLRINPVGGAVTIIELAIITKNMNSRIRSRGLSAKEIVLQRDQVTNEAKPSSDEQLATEQFEKRRKHHNPPKETKIHFEIGQNVFLKMDKTKLKAREMYKIVELFEKEDETWAKIQKMSSQFRSKSYDVKISEIFHVPGYMAILVEDDKHPPNCEAGGPVIEDKLKLESNFKNTESDDVAEALKKTEKKQVRSDDNYAVKKKKINDANEELVADEMSTVAGTGRPKRKAAIKCSTKIRDMFADSVLSLDVNKPKKIPTHGWDWEQFQYLCDQQDPIQVGKQTKQVMEDEDNFEGLFQLFNTFNNDEENVNLSEPELEWDDSAEQYDFSFLADNGDLDPEFASTKLFSSSESLNVSSSEEEAPGSAFLSTDSTSDDDNPPKSKLTRSYAFRRKKHTVYDNAVEVEEDFSSPSGPSGLQAPGNHQEVQLNKPQLLASVLPLRKPIIPETVHLGYEADVQDLGQAFAGIPQDAVEPQEDDNDQQDDDEPHEDEEVRVGRPRNQINYKTFHNYGRR